MATFYMYAFTVLSVFCWTNCIVICPLISRCYFLAFPCCQLHTWICKMHYIRNICLLFFFSHCHLISHVNFSCPALTRLRGCEVQSSELDEILQEQAEAKGVKPKQPWELFTDRSVRWQLISVTIVSSAMQLCGNDSVRTGRICDWTLVSWSARYFVYVLPRMNLAGACCYCVQWGWV